MKLTERFLLSTEHGCTHLFGPRLGEGIYEFLVFGFKEAALLEAAETERAATKVSF